MCHGCQQGVQRSIEDLGNPLGEWGFPVVYLLPSLMVNSHGKFGQHQVWLASFGLGCRSNIIDQRCF